MSDHCLPATTVFIVDDDEILLAAIDSLVRSIGLVAATFRSIPDYLEEANPLAPGCLVLDVRLPGMSGLDFLRRTDRPGNARPTIFMSGYADVPMSVAAMKAGAVEFLMKPLREQDMLDAIHLAIEFDQAQRSAEAQRASLGAAMARLTSREQQIMLLVIGGHLNKQIAATLGISEVTVKMHRRQIMRKMGVESLAALVTAASKLGLV